MKSRLRKLIIVTALVGAFLAQSVSTCAEEVNEEHAEQMETEETEADDTEASEDESGDAASEVISAEEAASEEAAEESEQSVAAQSGAEQLTELAEETSGAMKLNLLKAPYGVTKDALSFSWTEAAVGGVQSQSAYRIVVSKRKIDIQEKSYQYDTGWVESGENTSVLYDLSAKLEDNQLYYWQVQVKDDAGSESVISAPQAFTTAVGSEWAGKKGIWGSSGQKTVMMRQEIERSADVEKAVISVTAASTEGARQYVYNLYVNGEEIGVGPTRQDNSTLYYHSYDITDKLAEGKNVIGAINYAESGAGFLCQLTYYYADGTKKVVSNSSRDSESWKVLNADSIFIGADTSSAGTADYTAKKDNFNASLYPDGWQKADFAENGWTALTQTAAFDGFTLKPAQMDTVKRYEVVPESVTSLGNGSYLIDMGKEIVGTIKLSLNAKSSSVILEYGEELSSSGDVKYNLRTGNNYQEKWTLKAGSQTLSGIGMKTFRYIKIKGLYTGLSVDNVRGLAIRQAFDEEASDFTSSNKTLNELYALCKYTSQATNQGIYVDTQSRERKPYEGDSLITAMTSYSYSETSASSKASAEYLLNHTTWPAEYSLYNIMQIYENYMYTGDARNLEESYQLLKKKTMEQYFDESEGLIGYISGGSVAGQRVMVDWPNTENDNYELSKAYYNTVFNAVCVGGYEAMARLAAVLGHDSESSRYQNLADTIRSNMIEKLYDSAAGTFCDGLDSEGNVISHSAQHATAFALAFGVYSDQNMADRLCASIEDDQEVRMSIYGTYFLLQGLYRSNHGELARKIMSNSESVRGVRSWGYVMYGMNATTTPEAWNSDLKANMSLCHPWGSAPGSMLVRGMFGIQPTSAGFDTFQIKLQPGGVKQASVKVPTMKGQVKASYTLDGNGGISGTVVVPENSAGTLCLPTGDQRYQVYVDGRLVNSEYDNGYMTCELKAGTHNFSAKAGIEIDESEWLKTDALYSAYSNGNWSEEVTNGFSTSKAENNRIEAIRVGIRNQSISGDVEYAAYMQSSGWLDWTNSNQTAGLIDSGKRLEAMKIRLTGELANQYDIYYRTYVNGTGWLDWAENGEPAGTSGYAKSITMIQVKMVKKDETAPGDTTIPYKTTERDLVYSTHVQTYGWQAECGDGETSGTVGSAKRLEAIRISVKKQDISGGITYCTHVQSYGWQGWKSNGQVSGTSGETKRLEAIKIKLTGELAEQYDVYYRVHCQTYGWLGWAKNGESAGTEGYGKRLEAIQIKLVKKGNSAPGSTEDTFRKAKLAYRTHVQSYGWQSYVFDGATSGTSGEAKRLEAIQIKKADTSLSGSIQYRTHIQSYGWEASWKSNGQTSGTSGKAKRLEAIQIRLTGEMEKTYDVYYRVHAQTYGWLDWAKNGESAGTEGLSKRLEAIEIVLVEKGGKAPGKTASAFIKAE